MLLNAWTEITRFFDTAMDGGRHIGEHQTKNNIVTIGFPQHRNLGMAWKSVLFQWMSTQRNLEESIEQWFLAQATNRAKYSLSWMLTTSRRMNTMYQPRFRDCHAEHSNQHPIPFVLSVCLSVRPSLCLPPYLSSTDTHLFQIPVQFRQQLFPNTTSHRFYFPVRPLWYICFSK